MSIHKRTDRWLLLLSMLLSAGFLAICSKSSPLYPMNDWVDVNCFFTVGKSILNDIIPYRDLYEQKGPVLYFLYALAALISDKSFIGVYLLEVICFGFFLYFSGRIAQIYLGKCRSVYFIIAVLASLIPISPAFAHGGGAEELCLFMLAYGLYSVLLALREKRLLSFREAMLNGVFAAGVLYIKFTMLGFYIGLALFVIIWYLADGLQWRELLTTVAQFLLGIAAVSAVVWGYFLIHNAADDLFTVYFYNNLFLYPQEVDGTRAELIQNCLTATLQRNTSYSWLLCLGIALLILELRANWKSVLMILLSFLGLVIGTYWGGRGYTYYGLVLAVFAVFGLITIVRLGRLGKLSELIPKEIRCSSLIPICALIVSVALLTLYSYKNSQNVYLMAYDKDDMPAYQFAQTINQVEDATLLNYGFLDGGFYYAADVLPTCEFFCTLNINAPDMWAIQRSCIENGDVDFVITRKYPLNRYSADASRYILVDQAAFYFEGVDFTYYLYQKLPDA